MLTALDLCDNKIEQIPMALGGLSPKKLQSVRLSGNPLADPRIRRFVEQDAPSLVKDLLNHVAKSGCAAARQLPLGPATLPPSRRHPARALPGTGARPRARAARRGRRARARRRRRSPTTTSPRAPSQTCLREPTGGGGAQREREARSAKGASRSEGESTAPHFTRFSAETLPLTARGHRPQLISAHPVRSAHPTAKHAQAALNAGSDDAETDGDDSEPTVAPPPKGKKKGKK